MFQQILKWFIVTILWLGAYSLFFVDIKAKNMDENCFVKGSKFQLYILKLVHGDPHGLDIQLKMHEIPPYFQLFGEDWNQHWFMAGFKLLEPGDKVYKINNCAVDKIIKKMPHGGKTITPYINEGYISLFDILLVGPREEIVSQIINVEIERKGKKMILRPTEAIYRQIPK
jgi:hypothetical protein